MPDNATDSNTQRPTDLDAGWGELLGDANGVPELVPTDTSEAVALPPEPDDHDMPGEPALPKRSVNAMLDQMARMLDVGEGTGPLVDLRRVLAPELEPSAADVREPARASEASGASERTLITRRLRDDAPLLLELGDDAPRAVDEADDAPRLLTLTDAIPQPIEVGEESWPRRETKPLLVRPLDSGSLRASSEPVAARSGPAPVVPAKRSQWPWLAAAAVIVVGFGWSAMRPADNPVRASGAVVQAATAKRGEPEQPLPATPRATPAEPQAAVAKPIASAPVAAVVPEHAAPTPAAPTPTAPEAAPTPTAIADAPPSAAIEGASAELLASAETALSDARFEEAHTLASRAWADGHDNAAVRVMALAACELRDGALARSAFRKLGGPPIRKEVYARCRARAVNVRSNIEGYTPAELLAKARAELERGEHERAYEHARASNKLTHSAEALELMATSACHQHDADDAAHLLTMLPRDRKRAVQEACTSAGTSLDG